jgi:hypothetical protein
LFVVRVQSVGCACTPRADSDSDSHAVCFDSCTHEDYHTNMDKHTILDRNADRDPDIVTDKDGRAYIYVNGRKYRYAYADTTNDSSREKYPDAASIDTITPGKRGKRGGPNANRRNANK